MKVRSASAAAFFLLAMCLAEEAVAASRLFAVLPFDIRNTKGRMDESARSSLEDLLRDEAANSITKSGWTVLTGENTYALLRDNGVDPANCGEGECHVATARELNVEIFVSGIVHYVDGQFVVSVRLIETRTGRILASDRLEGETTMALHRAFQKNAADFFARAGLLVPSEASPAAKPTGDAFLFIHVAPPDARVLIDGFSAKAGSQGPFDAGHHVVRAEAEGFSPAEQQLDISRGTITRVVLELQPLTGRVLIHSNVEAHCNVGGQRIKVPAGLTGSLDVTTGIAHVVCRSRTGAELAQDVEVKSSTDTAAEMKFVILAPPVPKPTALQPTAGSAPGVEVAPEALKPQPAPADRARTWGWVEIGGAVVVAGGSAAFDNLAPTSHDNKLGAIDFLPVAGYLVAGGLGIWGIHTLVAP